MTRRITHHQVTIDDLDLGWEHIPGAMPADPELIERERRRAYAALAAGCRAECIPDQKIHVFHGDEEHCHCTTQKKEWK